MTRDFLVIRRDDVIDVVAVCRSIGSERDAEFDSVWFGLWIIHDVEVCAVEERVSVVIRV